MTSSSQTLPVIPLRTSEASSSAEPIDRLARPLRDLRISVLDRCNLRCTYCMPEESLQGRGVFLNKESLLSDSELLTLVRVFVELGVNKIRLTGGEPLLRPGLTDLVAQISAIPGVKDLAMTTNAILLPRHASALKQAGLGRITVSLDSLDETVFAAMSGNRGSAAEVLRGIAAAEQAGFGSLKINTVIQRGVNDDGVESFVEHFRGSGHILRFIEFMDVGSLNHWSREQVVPSAELLERIHHRWPLKPVASGAVGETARRYQFEDGGGELGFISSITQPFCGGCSRARVTADGNFYTCLFASSGVALRPMLRQGGAEQLQEYLRDHWTARGDRYSEARSEGEDKQERIEMFRMGG